MECLLRQLCAIPGPSGHETKVTSFLEGIMSENGFRSYADSVGNLICRKKGGDGFKVMLIAHCDEFGFVVKYISEAGYVYFSCSGKSDLSLLFGRHVIIIHAGEPVPGVICSCPIHLGGNDPANKEISSLWIDIGAETKDAAEKKVSVGDSITVAPVVSKLGDRLISCKALDNRSGVAVLLDVCAKLKDAELPFDLYVVFSVQEEVGLIGAGPASFSVAPDICIALDVTHATDVPGIDNRKYGIVQLNKGPVIPTGPNLSAIVQERLRGIAVDLDIPFQVEALPGFSGTEIAQVQVSGPGCFTGLVSIPCRYMHSPAETVSLDDIRNSSLLIETLLRTLDQSLMELTSRKRTFC